VALAAYGALAVGLFFQTWEAPASRVIGSNADPFVCVWFMRWFAFSASHGLNPFLTDYVNFPQGYNLMWNTPMPLVGWLLAPVTFATGPVIAYNLVITGSLALSALAAFLVFRRYVRNAPAAAVGGLVYGFSPYMVIQAVGHWHLVMAVTPPLILLLVDEIVVLQRHSPVKLGVLLGLVAVAQLLLAEELLSTEALSAAIGVTILALLHRDRVRARLPRLAKAATVAIVVAVPLAAYPLWVQFFGPNHISGVIQPRNVYVTDLLNFVVPTDFQWLSPPAALAISGRFTGNGSEWNGYLGVPLILAVTYATVRYWKEPIVRVFSLLAAGMAVLSLGSRLHVGGREAPGRLPYIVIDHLPLFGNILPGRLALYVVMAAALLLAVLVDRLLNHRGVLSPLAALAFVVLALVPLMPRLPYRYSPTLTPAFFTTADAKRVPEGAVALVAPYSSTPLTAGPVLWQGESGMRYKLAEGYFFTAGAGGKVRLGPEPFALSQRMLAIFDGTAGPKVPTAAEVEQYRADLRQHRIDVVIVGPMPNEEAMVQLFALVTGRAPEMVGGVFLWRDVGGVG
jgi:hypothetical protein